MGEATVGPRATLWGQGPQHTAAGRLGHQPVKEICKGRQQHPLGLERLSYECLFSGHFPQESSPEPLLWVRENAPPFFLSALMQHDHTFMHFPLTLASKQASHDTIIGLLQLMPKLEGGLAVSHISKIPF